MSDFSSMEAADSLLSYPLTASQLLLWTGQEMNPGIPLYNMGMSFEIQAEINIEQFQQAFQEVIRQTDAMRMVFRLHQGFPRQYILSEMNVELEIIDFSHSPQPESIYQSWLSERMQKVLELSVCGFDTALVKLSTQQWVWFFNPHHLIMDIWSISVVYRRLADLYEQEPSALFHPHPHPQFQTYLKEARISTPSIHPASHQFWNKKLAQLSQVPRLYGRKNLRQSPQTERIYLELGTERTERLYQKAKEKEFHSWTRDLALFHLIATAFAAWLYRISGQEQLSFGTPVHNRGSARLKETAGMFIEVLPLILRVEETDDFLTLFRTIREEANLLFRHAKAGISRPEHSRSFSAILNFIHTRFPDFGGKPTLASWLHPDHTDPGHPLRLHVMDINGSGELQLAFDLNCELFSEALRSKIPHHFLAMLDAFLEDHHQPIHAPTLLTPEEEEEILIRFNQTGKPESAHSVLALFRKQLAETPEHILLTDRESSWNYQDIDDASDRLAAYLRQSGMGANDILALYLKRKPELIIAILAVWKLGAAYLPIPANHPPEQAMDWVKDSEASGILSLEALATSISLSPVPLICLDRDWKSIMGCTPEVPPGDLPMESLAYVMYTSGSTGQPKGVMISHRALSNYVQWANETYTREEALRFPLFTMIGFDLTVTSLFVPMISGGQIVVYEEAEEGPDLAIFEVLEDNLVNAIKLTPSHLVLLADRDCHDSHIRCMIVGGEQFQMGLAERTQEAFGQQLQIYNEYGPTEATVGCICHEYDPHSTHSGFVPIGRPIANLKAYVLNSALQAIPQGVVGELYIGGMGLAEGYLNRADLTKERFLPNPFASGERIYQTGDFVRFTQQGELEYLGRKDQQVKIGGIRLELGEIEHVLARYPGVETSVVEVVRTNKLAYSPQEQYCTKCGLPINYPNAHFDEAGVCHLCHSFEAYQTKAAQYFRSLSDLRALFNSNPRTQSAPYDCIMLLSGGKDSTYALARLIGMGLRVLAYTLDNGYISEQAKANVRRVSQALGVDHIFGSTEAMDAIFVDSLHRHSNVCNGCFKTLYTLSTHLALEKGIPFIVTGLSRGQFFETRLTEELFRGESIDVEKIDQTILEARKAYHRVEDAVAQHLDVSMFADDDLFEKVRFVDFYRYCDVSLAEMMHFLEKKLPWSRPTDTGRSTNCLINQLGIYVHKREKGFHNYAFPYSWDVRIGHKTREETLEEIKEEIDEKEVTQIMSEIGYTPTFSEGGSPQLVGWYVSPTEVEPSELRSYFISKLPPYMIPAQFIRLEDLPLSPNGKIDRQALTNSDISPAKGSQVYVAPETEVEQMLIPIWTEVLQHEKIGVQDDFLELGGNSLAAIRLMARVNETFDLDLPLVSIFEQPKVSALAVLIEETILSLMEASEEWQE